MSMRGARWINAEVAGSRLGSDMMKPRLVRVARSFAMAVPVVFIWVKHRFGGACGLLTNEKEVS
jgi:hypothetical protein